MSSNPNANASACSVCQSHEHSTKKCPEIVEDVNRHGFYKPAGGMPQGGDDEDEHISLFEYYFGIKLAWSKCETPICI